METLKLRKEAKVNLVKGQRINLTKTCEKDSEEVRYAFVGDRKSTRLNSSH